MSERSECLICGPTFIGKCPHKPDPTRCPHDVLIPTCFYCYPPNLSIWERAKLGAAVGLLRAFPPRTAPADVPIASSYREGESVIASSYRPEPTAREWWSEKRQLCSTPPPHEPMFEVLHLIEYSAFEKLQHERDELLNSFSKLGAGAIYPVSDTIKKLQAALEAKEAERDKFAGALSIANHERDQARQELADANNSLFQYRKVNDLYVEQLAASQEREAKLREALELYADVDFDNLDGGKAAREALEHGTGEI